MGADEGHQQSLEEEERILSETLRKVFVGLVQYGDLDEEEFNFLVYRTGVREKFINLTERK